MTRHFWFLMLAFGLAACTHGMAAAPSAERAGLGTTWGETRESRVSWVAFERDDPQQPVALTAIRYDDGDGVRALLRDTEPDWAPPGGPLRVRLVDAWGVPLPAFTRDGQQLVQGHRGQRYAIEI